MDKEIYDEWLRLAAIREKDKVDSLRKVIDPRDTKGVKNSYIDTYLKFYLLELLSPTKTENLLEIGSGIGRLTEYMAPFAQAVYGIDVIQRFVDDCRSNPAKHRNTFYLNTDEIAELRDAEIDKLYTVWVLMYVTDRTALIRMLKAYRSCLPNLKSGIIIEPVKSRLEIERHHTPHGCYRTVDEYIEIFSAAGFKVKKCFIMGERYNGGLYKLIHVTANLLPRPMATFATKLFHVDRFLMGDNANRSKLINQRRPTDVAFQIELS